MRTTSTWSLLLVLVISATLVAGLGWTGTITAIAPGATPNAALVTTFTSTGLTTCIVDSDSQITVLTDVGTRLVALTVSDILDTTPLEGRTEPGYVGGFIIAGVLESPDGTLHCDTAQFNVDENVLGGSCWLDANGEIFVEGVHSVASTDHRVAPSHFITGSKADIPTFPNRLANCLMEGYFSEKDETYYFFSFTVGNPVTPFPVPGATAPETATPEADVAAVDEPGTTVVVPDAPVADETVPDATVDETVPDATVPESEPASTADFTAPDSSVSASSVADSVETTSEEEEDAPAPPSSSPSPSPYSDDESYDNDDYYSYDHNKGYALIHVKARLHSDDCNYHGHNAPALIIYGSHKLGSVKSILPETLSLGSLYPHECFLLDSNHDGREDLLCQYYGTPYRSYGKYEITGKTKHGAHVRAAVYPCNHRRHW